MNIIKICIAGFMILETSNVIALYFFPGSRYANSVGVFRAWERSKQDTTNHDLMKYLVNWVAGTKLIFILLLLVILITSDQQTLILTSIALVVSIASFYWRLFPLIKKMDKNEQIEPRNYSSTLGWMILAMLLVFIAAILLSI